MNPRINEWIDAVGIGYFLNFSPFHISYLFLHLQILCKRKRAKVIYKLHLLQVADQKLLPGKLHAHLAVSQNGFRSYYFDSNHMSSFYTQIWWQWWISTGPITSRTLVHRRHWSHHLWWEILTCEGNVASYPLCIYLCLRKIGIRGYPIGMPIIAN